MITTKIIKHDNKDFLMVFHQGQWWYYTDQIATYLDYINGAKDINKLLNDEHKCIISSRANKNIFQEIKEYLGGSSLELPEKTTKLSLINEDGLILSAIKSTKPNAKLLIQDMIKVFKIELDKAGLNALEYLLRVEKDKNILINARTTKYYNADYIKYNVQTINKTINELVFYKFFPNEKYGVDINTDKLREAYQTKDNLKDRDVSGDRYEVGNSILEMLYNYYLFNESHMSLRKAKYLYVKNNGYEEDIVEMFKERLEN